MYHNGLSPLRDKRQSLIVKFCVQERRGGAREEERKRRGVGEGTCDEEEDTFPSSYPRV